jgi:SIR2-like domain
MSDELLGTHVRNVLKAIVRGKVVPFFGAGVNLCDRQKETVWEKNKSSYLPSGAELSLFLAEQFDYPKDEHKDLAKISEYVDLTLGKGELYDSLHGLFDQNYPTTSIHCFFANLPKALSDLGYDPQHQAIVTTNYDDLMEQALTEQGVKYDILSYIAIGSNAGKFLHTDPDGVETVVHNPNDYKGIPVHDVLLNLCRPVVIKLHGAVKRQRMDAKADSYVITEDDYINYLTHADISILLPSKVSQILSRSHFLFLGYGLKDWNLRVILHRIWSDQTHSLNSWAVQRDPHFMEKKLWANKRVEILEVSLDQYMQLLEKELSNYPPKPTDE